METFQVNSLPLKDVIISLAKSFGVEYQESCEEYWLEIPNSYGKGQIRGINFDNGLGIIIYDCLFFKDITIEFTVNDVHPVKYLYSVEGEISHSFANEDIEHIIEKYRCAIVASKQNNGHILNFKKDISINILSLEIDRNRFIKNTVCEIDSLVSELKTLFNDIEAETTFYHDGFYGLAFREIFENLDKYEERALARKFFLESIALNVFVNQLIQFEDDLLNDDNRLLLRQKEVDAAMELTEYIKTNLSKDLTISDLSTKSGLNPNKLQKVFKYLFNNTVNSYITDIRLEKSYELLRKTDLNVSEVAVKVGFDNNSYFSKLFKQKYGVTPSVIK